MMIVVALTCVLVALVVYLSLPMGDVAPMRTPSPADAPRQTDDEPPPVTNATDTPRTETVTIAGEEFELELAIDVASRARGLSRRDSIDPTGGMLFVFPRPAWQSFWMKHCVTDIDLIFLDETGRITALHEMPVEPPQRAGETETDYENRLISYVSERPALFAIELAPGSIRRLGLQVEDRIELDRGRLKAMAR